MAAEAPEPRQADAAPALTRGQKGAIAALLSEIAQVVERYEIARGEPLNERLTYGAIEAPLTALERQQFDPLMVELIRAANALAQRSAVAPLRPGRRATLRGAFTTLWSDAEDSSVQRLGAYGAVSPAARAALGPALERVIRSTKALLTTSRLAALMDTADTADTKSAPRC